jgi:hypothetical protein
MNNEIMIKKLLAVVVAISLYIIIGGLDAGIMFSICLVLYAALFGLNNATAVLNGMECILIMSISGIFMLALPSNFEIFAMLIAATGIWLAVINVWQFKLTESE